MLRFWYGENGGQRARTCVALVLALFYVVAAGRGLVPGLCATMAMSEASADSRSAASCCTLPLAAAPEDGDRPHVGPVPADHPQCAFCTLVLTPVFPAMAAPQPVAVRADTALLDRVTDRPRSVDVDRANPGRAPPFPA